MAAPLTEAAIEKLRALVRAGEFRPGQLLPPEAALSDRLGVSRGILRQAVRALVTAGVLDVRRGDGTYVTSLSPEMLFTGIGDAVDLMPEESLLELMECRRVVEGQVTAMATVRASAEDLAAIAEHLQLMEAAEDEQDLISHDVNFHSAIAAASGNRALAAVLRGISTATRRARVWRALSESNAAERTVAEHAAIYTAMCDRDPALAASAAMVHVASVEAWMRRGSIPPPGSPSGLSDHPGAAVRPSTPTTTPSTSHDSVDRPVDDEDPKG